MNALKRFSSGRRSASLNASLNLSSAIPPSPNMHILSFSFSTNTFPSLISTRSPARARRSTGSSTPYALLSCVPGIAIIGKFVKFSPLPSYLVTFAFHAFPERSLNKFIASARTSGFGFLISKISPGMTRTSASFDASSRASLACMYASSLKRSYPR